MRQRRRIAALLVAGPLLLSAGCSGGDDEEPSASSSSSSSAATTTSPSPSPPTSTGAAPTDEELPGDASFPADTSDDGGPAQAGSDPDPAGQGGGLGIRLATHDGYDRLVIDLNTNGVPAWTVRYTEASGPGGGPVDIDGDAFLRLSLQTGAQPGGQGSSRATLGPPGTIAGVVTTGLFEGVEEVLIGVRGGEAPFRAFALTDPGRIVIDVKPAG
ncbi:hypothetical protein [Blastococcus sp. CT_GayMR16]|uniref:AMIN-like domain-containing (lipo)protein n=1 Tax=Blastococcus sp. CT_GayMR16 TaxID=2559607 RepID=UPI0010744E45|nr:hypothetical protein [Blastococcus sp. CT_GayMR16]TFV88256.1 hypothetical protein E4P38_10905 [Blastococcus sp. CT_GayMR16]